MGWDSGSWGDPDGLRLLPFTLDELVNGDTWTITHAADNGNHRIVQGWYNSWDEDESLDYDAADVGDYTLRTSVYSSMTGDEFALASPARALHLHFEDGAGVTVTDSSGGSHDGTMTNMDAADWITGGAQKIGTFALSFAGYKDSLDLANDLKSKFNSHTANVSEHLLTSQTIVAADATTLTTLIALVTELLTDYTSHDEDVDEVIPTYHQATSALNALVSAAAPTTIYECVTRLNDLKAKYNLHQADATSHTTGNVDPCSQADTSDPGYVTIPDPCCNVDFTDNFTFEGWVYVHTTAGDLRPILSKIKDNGSGGLVGWRFYISGSGSFGFSANNYNGATQRTNYWLTAAALTTGWHHVVVQHIGNANSQLVTCNCCVDKATQTFNMATVGGGLAGNTIDSDAAVTVGGIPTTLNPYYAQVYVDELVFYSLQCSTTITNKRYDTLSASEINYLTEYAAYAKTNTNQINTATWSGIDGVLITETVPANTHAFYAFSVDGGTTWYYWRLATLAWQSTNLAGLITITLGESGTKAQYEALTRADWDAIFVAGTLDVYAHVYSTDLDATAAVSQVTVNGDLPGEQVLGSALATIEKASTTTTTVENISGVTLHDLRVTVLI